MAVSSQDIQNWIAQNPNATAQQQQAAMQQYGVSQDQVNAALGVSGQPLSGAQANQLMQQAATSGTYTDPNQLAAYAKAAGVPDYIANTYSFMVDPRVHKVQAPDGGTMYQVSPQYSSNYGKTGGYTGVWNPNWTAQDIANMRAGGGGGTAPGGNQGTAPGGGGMRQDPNNPISTIQQPGIVGDPTNVALQQGSGGTGTLTGNYQTGFPYPNAPNNTFLSGMANMMSANNNFTTSDPSYQFRYQQGLDAVNRNLAAQGGTYSGNALLEAQKYGQGMASTEFQNQFNRMATGAGVQNQTTGLGMNYALGAAGAYQNQQRLNNQQDQFNQQMQYQQQLLNAQGAGQLLNWFSNGGASNLISSGSNLLSTLSGLFGGAGGSNTWTTNFPGSGTDLTNQIYNQNNPMTSNPGATMSVDPSQTSGIGSTLDTWTM